MRKLASIRKITELRPIPGADRIEVAQVDGWQCVVRRGEFQEGEHIVYVEIDSIVPERPEFEFLRDRGFRVRTIRLRGQVSEGLVLPMSVLDDGIIYDLGDDVTDVLGIKKYDPEARQEGELLNTAKKKRKSAVTRFLLRFGWYRRFFGGDKRGGRSDFPDWIAKTDETRIQNLPSLFENERDAGTEFSVTEKMDGQSATYYLRRKRGVKKYEFGVCSRNIKLAKPDDSSYWTVAKQYEIENVLRGLIGKNDFVVMQGEICGRGIQKNKYGIDGYRLFVFNLIFPDGKCTTEEIAKYLSPYGVQTVPIVEEGKTLPGTIAEMVEYSRGESFVRRGAPREGVVVRNTDKNISFKVINPDYLLAEVD